MTILEQLEQRDQFTKLGISVIHPMQYYESIAVSATARPTDVSLFLSYSGNLANNLAEEMRILRHVGCKIILITPDGS